MDNAHDLMALFSRGNAAAEARLKEVFATQPTFTVSRWVAQGDDRSKAGVALVIDGGEMLSTPLEVYKRYDFGLVWMATSRKKSEKVGRAAYEGAHDLVRKQARVVAERLGKEELLERFAQLKASFERECARRAARAASAERTALADEIARLSALMQAAQGKLAALDAQIEASLDSNC